MNLIYRCVGYDYKSKKVPEFSGYPKNNLSLKKLSGDAFNYRSAFKGLTSRKYDILGECWE